MQHFSFLFLEKNKYYFIRIKSNKEANILNYFYFFYEIKLKIILIFLKNYDIIVVKIIILK